MRPRIQSLELTEEEADELIASGDIPALAHALGFSVVVFDEFNCVECGVLSSESSGGVTPDPIDAFCKDCWEEVKDRYEA